MSIKSSPRPSWIPKFPNMSPTPPPSSGKRKAKMSKDASVRAELDEYTEYEPDDIATPEDHIYWVQGVAAVLAAWQAAGATEEELAGFADSVFANHAEHLVPLAEGWPHWAQPHIVDAYGRALTNRAVREQDEREAEEDAKAAVRRMHLLVLKKKRGEVTAPSQDAEPLVPVSPDTKDTVSKALKRKSLSAVESPSKRAKVPKCNYCGGQRNTKCVLHVDERKCDKCIRHKKGCNKGNGSYADWFDSEGYERAPAQETSASAPRSNKGQRGAAKLAACGKFIILLVIVIRSH
ncbi:hypothetical protein LXA43DRAFT_417503 [Ganoderma leucocontextum]|nr:hypothetical protein LXA43DRAFT_417503 [Ganoderma leucocontextum]